MKTEEIVKTFVELGIELKNLSEEDNKILTMAYVKNNWFTLSNIQLAINSIANEFLGGDKLNSFSSLYKLPSENTNPKKVGLVMAGNIPLVGFHDFLCVILSGNKASYKLSSKDDVLFKWVIDKLFKINPMLIENIIEVDRLNDIDAVIATGSNNSARYFEYYFSKYPHIIRKNRSSVAVIKGNENEQELRLLAKDIFAFFGLGCRNVSKLFVPENFDVVSVLSKFDSYLELVNHHKYKNNYDYNSTIMLMNQTPFFANDFVCLTENKSVSSPIAVIHFERYNSEDDLNNKLIEQAQQIQCVVGKDFIPFGGAQKPSLTDYADNIDVMKFLLNLK